MESVTSGRKMDGWYSWVVCSAVFLIEFIVMGLYTSFGTIFVALIAEFKATESSAAWVGSVAFAVCYTSSFGVNLLLRRIGYREICCIGSVLFGVGLIASSFANATPVLFVTYGVIYGAGSGLVHFSSILVIPKFFKFRRGIAYGVALSGHGIGALPVGYLLDVFIANYGIRIALRLTAILALPLFGCGLIFGSASANNTCKLDKKCQLEREEKAPVQRVWKNKALLSFSISMWMYGFGYYIPSVHLVNMAEGVGVPLIKATLLPSSIAIAQSVGKIVFGQIAMSLRGVKAVYYCQVTIFICGLVTTFSPLMNSFGALLSYTIIYGFFDSCSTVFTLKIIEDLLGEGGIEQGFTFHMVGMAFFLLIGPPAAGFLYEVTGSYEIPFFLAGGFCTLCVCLLFLVTFFRDRRREEEMNKEEFSRKISILSIKSTDSSNSQFSTDSGISLQINSNKQEDDFQDRKASISSSLSSSSHILCLSDYETDSAGIDCLDSEKGSLNNSFDEDNSYCLSKEKVNSFCWSSEYQISRETFLVAERETVL